MKKVITYGTYDLLHEGHIHLLERAKKLGDYLIVGVTSDDFDRRRGKINVRQPLIERIEAVKNTGLADEIIIEEYEGQKIDDIRNYNVDIFAIGSDWTNKFDYLNEYCTVVYLPRTEGISSTQLRSKEGGIQLGFISEDAFVNKVIRETAYVNSIQVSGFYGDPSVLEADLKDKIQIFEDKQDLIDQSNALYIYEQPKQQVKSVAQALESKRHVLAEAPLCLSVETAHDLFNKAEENHVQLVLGLRTPYCTAYNRLLLMVKSGVIGKPVQVQSVCTSMKDYESICEGKIEHVWSSASGWSPTALLPILQIFGPEYVSSSIVVKKLASSSYRPFDLFTNIHLIYPDGVADCTVGVGYRGDNSLTIIGDRGYIFVPSPWWKTDYFEIRYEDSNENKRYYYQLDGEGIRNELVEFKRIVNGDITIQRVSKDVVFTMTSLLEKIKEGNYVTIQ